MKKVYKAGYAEKDAALSDGTTIHYAEGPSNGNIPLLLIHGQTGCWEDYADTLPLLTEKWHVFAVDCHGHGKSCKNPEKYTSKAIGEDLLQFIREYMGGKAVVSGHSSGGLISAWIAANFHDEVIGAVLEDPPFFSTEKGERWEKSFAYVDTYEPMHRFLNQTEEKDWSLYYIKNSAWAKFIGEKGINGMIKYGEKYRKRNPDKPLRFFFLPASLNHMFEYMDMYDLRFGDKFYDSTWFEEYDQRDVMSRIHCPSVLIHTNAKPIPEEKMADFKDILMGAMSPEDAKLAHSIIPDNELIEVESGHDFHAEKPKEFAEVVNNFHSRVI